MNERIRELMEEVVSIEIDPDSKMETIYTCGPEDFEAFAELIVRECMSIVSEPGPDMNDTERGILTQIKNHFGVEQ